MFDFEKLDVYEMAKEFHSEVSIMLLEKKIPHRSVKDQLSRASLSIVLNIAEGTSRFTKPSKRNYYVIARGSTFECVAVLDILRDKAVITEAEYQAFYRSAEDLSRMLYKMIKILK